MSDATKYFYIMSFTARERAGVAIAIAYDERSARMCLKQQGIYNATPDDYDVTRVENVGKYCDCAYGLMAESCTPEEE